MLKTSPHKSKSVCRLLRPWRAHGSLRQSPFLPPSSVRRRPFGHKQCVCTAPAAAHLAPQVALKKRPGNSVTLRQNVTGPDAREIPGEQICEKLRVVRDAKEGKRIARSLVCRGSVWEKTLNGVVGDRLADPFTLPAVAAEGRHAEKKPTRPYLVKL